MLVSWDSAKARANLAKHGVSLAEGASVFDDPLSMTFPDPDHSAEESRFVTIGQSTGGQVLVVIHADRKTGVRLISVRRATRRERHYYEGAQTRL